MLLAVRATAVKGIQAWQIATELSALASAPSVLALVQNAIPEPVSLAKRLEPGSDEDGRERRGARIRWVLGRGDSPPTETPSTQSA